MTGWLHPADADPDAAARLILLHHAGGSATSYGPWLSLFPTDVAVQAVQLPGRHERRNEPPYTMLAPLVEALVAELEAELDDRPYALFGHSMGAMLAYRLANRLHPSPVVVGLSGWLPSDGRSRTPLSSDASAALEADLAVCTDFRDDGAPVDGPAVAYAGREDALAPPEDMAATWKDRCGRFHGVKTFPGDHFFLHEHAAAIANDLTQLIRREVPAWNCRT